MNKGIAYQGYYEQYYSNRTPDFYKFLLNQIITFSYPGTILDIGCGSGLFLEACTQWNWECIGIEGSSEAVELIRRRNPTLNIIHQSLDLKFKIDDSSIQTVVINQVIEHLENDIQLNCLSEAYRVLKPNGTIIVHSPSKFNKKERLADNTHINLLSPSTLKRYLQDAGFRKIIDINSPLVLWEANFITRFFSHKLFSITKSDFLSATASFIAVK